eukprot:4317562-Pyramimonas_sp.AAC.1
MKPIRTLVTRSLDIFASGLHHPDVMYIGVNLKSDGSGLCSTPTDIRFGIFWMWDLQMEYRISHAILYRAELQRSYYRLSSSESEGGKAGDSYWKPSENGIIL